VEREHGVLTASTGTASAVRYAVGTPKRSRCARSEEEEWTEGQVVCLEVGMTPAGSANVSTRCYSVYGLDVNPDY